MISSTKNNHYHTPVLLQSVIDALLIRPGNWYVDCTLGGGGHTQKILEAGGFVLGIDQDLDAINETSQRLKQYIDEKKLIVKKSNFSSLKEIVKENKVEPSGILFDLGVSTHQLTGVSRGFSFQINEELDMRMDPQDQTVTARNLINGLYEKELEKLITTYGEDPLARDIAHAIVIARKFKPIETTGDLTEIVKNVYHRRYRKPSRLNPATRTFQALRIAVNDELNVFKKALSDSLEILNSQGRIVVISFHGLEDKIAKQNFKLWQEEQRGKSLHDKPLVPEDEEVFNNPASRSAKLRVFEKNETQ
jgi:16S rRNA (cytosine1402-N4)-methyltransferase